MIVTNRKLFILFLSVICLISHYAKAQQSLSNPGNPHGVLIGDLDITGNQVTVEALIKRTAAGGPNIVSKHTDPSNVNYLLRPTTFELTTTNGFLLMNNPYTLQNNRWYHIAGTYDGAFVRYYVNGCLVVEQPWSGNLVTNNLATCIGNISTAGNSEGFIGQIDEVRIWNIARTENEIRQNMINLPAPNTYPNLRAYYKFEGNYNNVLGTGFNGTLMGSPSLVATTGDLPIEFQVVDILETDNVVCGGEMTGSITAIASTSLGTTYSLNGGTYQSGNVFSNLPAGNYTVNIRSQEGCILSESVTIADGMTLDAGVDQVICSGETAQLAASGGSGDFTWDAHPSLSSVTIANPTVTPYSTTIYTVRSKVRVGPNLVTNGSFEMGNTGFSSGYNHYVSGELPQGSYAVTNNPVLYNGGFAACNDHTTSSGLMLLADAACGTNGVPSNTDLWCQTIAVTPNTDYEFSAWMANVVGGTSSSLLFSINGTPIGNPAPTSTTTCDWQEFFVSWNSGGATSATICIAEGTGVCNGNDFSIDDISFYEICELIDQVTVTVSPLPVITGADAEVCPEGSVTLTVSGADTYSWSPGTYLSATTGASVVFTAGAATSYTVTGTDMNGCSGSTTVSVAVSQLSSVEAGTNYQGCENDQVVLSAAGSGPGTYVWSNGVPNNTSFSPPVGVNTYYVVFTDEDGCVATDSLIVDIQAIPVISFTAVQSGYCYPVTAQFTNTTQNVQNCVWTMDNGDILSGCTVTYTFNEAGTYGALLQAASSYGCVGQLNQSSLIVVDEYPQAYFSHTPNQIHYLEPSVVFENQSVGASSYLWDFGDESSFSTVESPTHEYPSELEEEGYTVTLIAFSPHNCPDTAIRVISIRDELIVYIPNTFTPDGDQFNQVFQPVFTSGFDPFDYTLLIFNRWGERVFESHNAAAGWDGMYGGKPCQSGTYTWQIEVKTTLSDERKRFTGHVNLLR